VVAPVAADVTNNPVRGARYASRATTRVAPYGRLSTYGSSPQSVTKSSKATTLVTKAQ